VVVSSINSRSAHDTSSYRKGSRAKRNGKEKCTHKSSSISCPNLFARTGAVPDNRDEDDDARIEHAG
jgi:hypothetical protein